MVITENIRLKRKEVKYNFCDTQYRVLPEKNPEWVILDNMQTYNGATWYKLKVLPNTSTSERGGIIVIRGLAENECELEILVIQAAGKPKGGNENTTTGGEITIE